MLTSNGSCYTVWAYVYAAELPELPLCLGMWTKAFMHLQSLLLSRHHRWCFSTPLRRLFSYRFILRSQAVHRLINFQVVRVGLTCLLVIQAAAKSESVPVMAQEFTRLFTVAALKIPRTSPTSPSVNRQMTTDAWQGTSLNVSSSAIPVSAVLHGMDEVGRNVMCCCTSFLYFIQLMMMCSFYFSTWYWTLNLLHLRYDNLAKIKLTTYDSGNLELITWVWGVEIQSVITRATQQNWYYHTETYMYQKLNY